MQTGYTSTGYMLCVGATSRKDMALASFSLAETDVIASFGWGGPAMEYNWLMTVSEG